MLTSHVTVHFKRMHLLLSREDFPISAYPLLVQGLRNDINRGFTQDFDDVLGPGSRAQISSMIRVRFNMNGLDPTGRKVGLLDRHHLMAFLVDPFGHDWRAKFELQTPLATLMREMIELYIKKDDNGSNTKQERVMKEFMVS